MDNLVSTEWLANELGADDLVILDCTVWLERNDDGFVSTSGRATWEAGHIPGAGFADLDGDLADPASDLRYAVPAPEAFAEAMAALGVTDERRVVLYDDNGSMWAARVWWMLRWVGFDNAAILDGGMKAWRAEERPITADVSPEPPAGSLSVSVRPSLIASKDDVHQAIDDGATCLIDALPGAMYRGEITAYGRAGHIPGALNVSAAGLLDDDGRFRPTDELRAKFSGDPGARTIAYCGGGIAASADAFAMTRLGFTDVAVYTASLQEWTADPDAPLVTA